MISLLREEFDVIASASDGRIALELIRSHKPDVVVLDLPLLWLKGLRIGEEIAALRPTPRIVICSTATDPEIIEATRQANVSAYVFKTKIETDLTLAVKTAAQGGFFASVAPAPAMPEESGWTLSGTYVESCNCEMTCLRVSLAPPKALLCTALFGWHIDSGMFNDTNLNGLSVAAAMYSPRNASKWRAAMYIDDRATPSQSDALRKIFTGKVGGHPVNLANEMAVLLGVRLAPIKFRSKGKYRSLKIAGIADVEIEGVQGYRGEPITITNHPVGTAPGFPAELSKSKRLSYSDYGLEWDLSETTGFFAPFRYENS